MGDWEGECREERKKERAEKSFFKILTIEIKLLVFEIKSNQITFFHNLSYNIIREKVLTFLKYDVDFQICETG